MEEEKSYFRMSGLRQKGTEKQQNMDTLGKIFTDTFHYQGYVKDSLISFARNINTRNLNLMLLALAIDSCNTLLVSRQMLDPGTFAELVETRKLIITKESTNFSSYHYELYSYIMLVINSNPFLQRDLLGVTVDDEQQEQQQPEGEEGQSQQGQSQQGQSQQGQSQQDEQKEEEEEDELAP